MDSGKSEPVSVIPPGFGTIDRRAALVGRVAEIQVLEQSLQDVRDHGKPRVVTLLGANGVGKTRLVRDFLSKRLSNERGAPRVFRGSAREGSGAYGVFSLILRARFGIVEGVDDDAARAQVRQHVSAVLQDRQVDDICMFLGQLMHLEFTSSPLVDAVRDDAAAMSLLRRSVLTQFIETDARRPETAVGGVSRSVGVAESPIVLLFDDLHVAARESLALIEHLIDSLVGPVLILCLARPELLATQGGWAKAGGSRHRLVDLEPLNDSDAARVMISLLAPCGGAEGVAELVDAAVTLAGGNPALLERMVSVFRDHNVLQVRDEFAEPETWSVHAERLSEVRLPLTVVDAVQARISALSADERDVLERAATMGSVFWMGGLLSIARLDASAPDMWTRGSVTDDAAIRATLKELRERDYILTLPDSTFPDEEEFAFKHNLERETLLALLPRGQAIRFHKAVADWLSFKPAVRTHEEHLGQLARHQSSASLVVQAAATFLDAADLARSRHATAKASEYYIKGLGLLRDGAEGSTEQQLRALHNYGDVLHVLGKNDEALDAFNEMLVRAYRLNLRSEGAAAHTRIGRLYRDTGRLDEAQQHLESALALFEDVKSDAGVASTADDIGKLWLLRGNHSLALQATQRGLTARRKLGDRRSIARSLNNLGLVYQDSGQFKLALDAFEQSLRIRREIADLVGVAVSLNNLGTVAQDQHDDARALTLFLEAREVANESGSRRRLVLVLTNLGATELRLGNPAQAVHHLGHAVTIAEELGDKLGLGEALRVLSEAHLAQRATARAHRDATRAVDIFRTLQCKVQLGVALRTLGEIASARVTSGVAEADSALSARTHLLQSIWVFEEIGNDVELARSCSVYATVLRSSPDVRNDAAALAEAEQFAKRAQDIVARAKLAKIKGCTHGSGVPKSLP